MYEQPVKIIKKVKRKKVVRAARSKEVDTGNKQVIEIVRGKGLNKTITKEERPIMERVFMEAEHEIIEEEKEYHGVKVKETGEMHEFATKAEAHRFIRESS